MEEVTKSELAINDTGSLENQSVELNNNGNSSSKTKEDYPGTPLDLSQLFKFDFS